uniref:Vesicle transport protein USE1 n=2 Tax=Lygus hesperus TaxID=30085 RepID=A0A146LE13_LYGHE
MRREEIDLRRLLGCCETMAKGGIDEDEWRLKKFVEKADELLTDLKSKPCKPDVHTLHSYASRIQFLKGMLEVSAIKCNPLEKVNVMATVPNFSVTEETKDIYHTELQKVQEQIRENLFSRKSELRLRKSRPGTSSLSSTISESTDFTNSSETDAMEMDAILKYHHTVQEKIADNMITLAKNIKEQSLIANTIIKGDTKRVEDSTLLADKNIVDLKKNSDKLQEHTKSNWQCWTWLILLMVLMSFIGMVMIMKVFKKKI